MVLKQTLKQIVQSTALAGAIAIFGGCEIEESDSVLPNKQEYVNPGAADIRGTWYDKGLSGGWYGPNKTWGFSWWYLKQYGTNIEGKFEQELYRDHDSYDSLEQVTGVRPYFRFDRSLLKDFCHLAHECLTEFMRAALRLPDGHEREDSPQFRGLQPLRLHSRHHAAYPR